MKVQAASGHYSEFGFGLFWQLLFCQGFQRMFPLIGM
ncbi:hypothetical protein BAY1663_02757 [Pseudomonas sp. BAY1663]|nr:hypothetical protein BAY1663_02757 [Pseudomonas sp. BAY1663]